MKFVDSVLDLIFPPICKICGNKLDEKRKACICAECWGKIRIIKPPACVSCGKQLKIEHEIFCGDCSQSRMSFVDNRSAAVYDDVMRAAIHLFKYGDKRKLGVVFGEMMAEFIEKDGGLDDIDCIIPVPSFGRKRRDFNQSALLADYLGKRFDLPVYKDVLFRATDTLPQHGLNRDERIQNVKGAFEIKNKDRIKWAVVLLVDDILTTGATADECARALLSADANSVRVFTLARGE